MLLTAATLGLAFGSAQAASTIGVNFGASSASTTIGAADSAGVVSAVNWNNLSGLTGSIAVNNNDNTQTANVAWTVSEQWTMAGTAPAANPGSGTLMNGFFSNNGGIGSPQTITISSIPYATYDLYIYSSHDRTGRTVTTFSEQAAAFAATTIAENVTTAAIGADPFVFNAVTAGTSGTGNYVKFSGLTASQLDIDFISGSAVTADQDRTGFSGFQIVQIPEPSAALLGAFGLLGLLRRRRA